MALSAELLNLGYTTVRVYTMALRFPRMVGKGFNGERLPGGPYTIHQFLGGGLIFGLSGISAYYVPVVNPLINLLIGALLALIVGNILATIPVDGIPIFTRMAWVAGLLASTAPSTSELMPTTSPVTVVGGEVTVLPPPRLPAARPHGRHGGDAPPSRPARTAIPKPSASNHPPRIQDDDTQRPRPRVRVASAPHRPSAPAASNAASVFGALIASAE